MTSPTSTELIVFARTSEKQAQAAKAQTDAETKRRAQRLAGLATTEALQQTIAKGQAKKARRQEQEQQMALRALQRKRLPNVASRLAELAVEAKAEAEAAKAKAEAVQAKAEAALAEVEEAAAAQAEAIRNREKAAAVRVPSLTYMLAQVDIGYYKFRNACRRGSEYYGEDFADERYVTEKLPAPRKWMRPQNEKNKQQQQLEKQKKEKKPAGPPVQKRNYRKPAAWQRSETAIED